MPTATIKPEAPYIWNPSQKNLRKCFKIISGSNYLKLGRHTCIMGVVNLTPDSFSQDGCLKGNKNNGLRHAQKLIKDGADIIDIGGESTRPRADRISEKEEINRIIPTIKNLAKKSKIPISVDTYKPAVAKHALDAGATIVNNIMGTNPEKSLLKMVRDYKANIVLMHIRGIPRTMQKNIYYKNVISEIIDSLKKSIENCLEIGINLDRIIIDPGIGFGKTVEHNLKVINRLDSFKALNRPILIGTSRKSFIGKVLDKDVPERLIGTVASVCASILKGAHIVRVHDVKTVKQAAVMTDAILNEI